MNRLIKDPRKEVKIKEASQMNHIVSVVTNQIHEMQSVPTNKMEDLTDDLKLDDNTVLKNRLLQLVAVMQQGGQFKGFNRKIQIRTLKWNVKNTEDIVQEVSQSKMNISTISSPVLQSPTNDTVDSCLKQKSVPPLSLDTSMSDSLPIVNSIQADQLATTSIIDPSTDSSTESVILPGAEESHFELRQGVERVYKIITISLNSQLKSKINVIKTYRVFPLLHLLLLVMKIFKFVIKIMVRNNSLYDKV